MDKISYFMDCFASTLWLVLAVVVFVRLRKWDKCFQALYDEMKKLVSDE